jgi:riboflavin synthase
MFTGLIEHMGTVQRADVTPAGKRIVVACTTLNARDVNVGDSIAIDGCCLTVATEAKSLAGGAGASDAGCELTFDVIPQTLALTTLGSFTSGRRVHIEPSLTLASRLGGHMVQGHVDSLGVVQSVQTQGQWRMRVGLPAASMSAVVAQGSVALQGVSLTIAACGTGRSEAESWLEVALIPTTLEKTTLASLRVGDRINVELDQLAKQIATQVAMQIEAQLDKQLAKHIASEVARQLSASPRGAQLSRGT